MSWLTELVDRLVGSRVRRPLPPQPDLGDGAWRRVEFGAGAVSFDARDPARDPRDESTELVVPHQDILEAGIDVEEDHT